MLKYYEFMIQWTLTMSKLKPWEYNSLGWILKASTIQTLVQLTLPYQTSIKCQNNV